MAEPVVIFTTRSDVEARIVTGLLEAHGVQVTLVDVGVLGPVDVTHDVAREEIALLAGTTVAQLEAAGDRGAALDAMARGAAAYLRDRHAGGDLAGVIGLGGWPASWR